MAFRFAPQESLGAENRTVTFHGLLASDAAATRNWSIVSPARPKFSLEAGATDVAVAIRIPAPEGEYLGAVATVSLTGGVFVARTKSGADDIFTFNVADASAVVQISFQISYNQYPDI
jgi:hypothetical protein